MKLIVLYPHPTDANEFDANYERHLNLLHEKAGIPKEVKPYSVTKFLPTPNGAPEYYQMFTMPFESPEAMNAAMASSGMQEVAADSVRISTGGAPVMMVGA